MRPFSLALLCATTLSFSPAHSQVAHAQVVTEPLVDDQYHVVQIVDGVLRIDRQSGEVTECRDDGNGWICRLAADDRQAYEAEINRLDLEIGRLESELSSMETEMEALRNPDASASDPSSPDPSMRERLDLPTDEELDAVMDTAEEAMRRFFGIVQGLREDMEADETR